MAQALGVASGLEDRQVAQKVGPLVSEGVVDGVAHPGLGGEVDDAFGPAGPHQGGEGLGLGDVQPVHDETGPALQGGGAGELQSRVVVVVEVVDAHDALAAIQQPFGHGPADEAGGAGDEDGVGFTHERAPGRGRAGSVLVVALPGPQCRRMRRARP